MTKKILAIALLTAAVALVGCSKSEEASEEAAAEAGTHEAQSSSAGLPAGNIAAGEKLASTKNAKTGQACVDCHGAEGNAPTDKSYPKLGGQYSDYIEHALLAYRKGDRDNSLMSPQAKELTDQQIADLGAYFHSTQTHLYDLHNAQ